MPNALNKTEFSDYISTNKIFHVLIFSIYPVKKG